MENVDNDVIKGNAKGLLRKQYLLLFTLAALYFANCFCRTSMVANQLNFVSEYSVKSSDVGLIIALFGVGNGLGQIINSIFIKYYNKRFSIAIPVLCEGILTFSCFFAFDFQIYKFIWCGIGICHSFLWMSIMKILSENLDDKILGRASVALSVCGGVGTASSILVGSLLTHFEAYRLLFLIGGALIVAIDILFYIISWNYKCSPKEYDTANETTEKKYHKLPLPKFAFVILASLILFAPIANIGYDCIKTWSQTILYKSDEGFGLSKEIAIVFTAILPVIQSSCSAIALLMRKKGLKYQMIISIVMIVACVSLGTIMLALNYRILALFIVFSAIAYLMFIIMNSVLTNLYPLQIRNYYDSGILSGVLNGAAWCGSAIATYCVPLLAEYAGWNSIYVLLISLSGFVLAIAVMLLVIFNKKEEYKTIL